MTARALTRTMLLLFACCIAVAACATAAPTVWARPDGRPVDPAQLQLDQTICKGEVQKADLAGNNDEIELLRAKSRADIMAGCMAQHGYRRRSEPSNKKAGGRDDGSVLQYLSANTR